MTRPPASIAASLKSRRFRQAFEPPPFQMQPRWTGPFGAATTVVHVLPPSQGAARQGGISRGSAVVAADGHALTRQPIGPLAVELGQVDSAVRADLEMARDCAARARRPEHERARVERDATAVAAGAERTC